MRPPIPNNVRSDSRSRIGVTTATKARHLRFARGGALQRRRASVLASRFSALLFCSLLLFMVAGCDGSELMSAPVALAAESGKAAPQATASTAAASTVTEGAPAMAVSTDAGTQGVDVSHDQGQIDWTKVRADGVDFAYAKATGGLTLNDRMFSANWKGIEAAGLLRGAYHFYYAGDSPVGQVDHFLRIVGELLPSDLPPMVDIEPGSLAEKRDIAPSDLQKNVLTFLQTLEKRIGRRPVVYTDAAFADRYLNDPRMKRYPLWLAQYEVKEPSATKAWGESGWTIWQYSQSGKIAGIEGDVDRDVFRGSREQLARLP